MQRSTEQLTRCSTVTLEEVLDNTEGTVATRTVSDKIMSACTNTIRWVHLLDLFLALTMIVLLTILELGNLPAQHLGFYCNDPKLSFKFTGDTISIALLIVASFIIPIIVMLMIEYACYRKDSYDTASGWVGSRLKQIWSWYGQYLVGLVTLTLILDVIKVIIGEPRPHFLDTCRPREAENCTNEYVEAYTCTNTIDSNWFVSDSSKSFPSGHSALSMYTTVFTVWYLQKRLSNRTLLVKPWLQCVICTWTVVCSLTRINDRRHHWWDVLAGDVLGAFFGVFTIIVQCRKFYPNGNASQDCDEPIENGQLNFNDKRHQSVKKLLSDPSMDISEGRELKNITAHWKE